MANTNYTTSDFKTSLDEVVQGASWASGNNILVIFYNNVDDASQGDYRRSFFMEDHATEDEPKLTVNYTVYIPSEFNTYTFLLTVVGAVIIILIVRRYVFAPAKVRVRK